MQLGTGRRNHYRVHRALDPCRCTDRNRESWDRSADEMIGTKSSGNGIEKRSVVKGRQAGSSRYANVEFLDSTERNLV